MKNILTVLRFEYKGFVSAKAFRVVTIIFVVGILVATSIPQIAGAFQSAGMGVDGGMGFGGKDKAAIILSGEALTNDVYKAMFAAEALAAAGYVEWEDLSADHPTDEDLATAIGEGEYIFALKYSGGTDCEFFAAGNRMTSYEAMMHAIDYITEACRAAETAVLPAETRDAVERISSLEANPVIVDIGGNAQNNFLIGYALIMFMFYVIMGYTNYVSSSVVTEKTSKAMELLVTAVKPLHLMVGKVLGVGFAALTQVGAIIGAAAAGIAINLPYWVKTNGALLEVLTGGNVGASVAVILIVYFLLGFFLYAFLAAAFASTVTKPEEAATVMTLPILLVMASLGLGFVTLLGGAASKGVAAALSYVPFFTPVSMMARYTLGEVGIVQLLIGAAIIAGAIVIVAMLAAKIFRMGVMLYGVKATPKQIIKALKSS